MSQIVSLGYGKVTFSASSASLGVFCVSDGWVRNLPSKLFAREGGYHRVPSSQYPDVSGWLYQESIKVPDGTILLLQVSHRSNALPVRDGALPIVMRANGPMMVIQGNIPPARESTITQGHMMFQGRGDILLPDDYEAYNFTPNKGWVSSFTDAEEVAECFNINTLSEGTAKPRVEVVENREGEAVVVRKRPTRRIRIR